MFFNRSCSLLLNYFQLSVILKLYLNLIEMTRTVSQSLFIIYIVVVYMLHYSTSNYYDILYMYYIIYIYIYIYIISYIIL